MTNKLQCCNKYIDVRFSIIYLFKTCQNDKLFAIKTDFLPLTRSLSLICSILDGGKTFPSNFKVLLKFLPAKSLSFNPDVHQKRYFTQLKKYSSQFLCF